jgi:cytochrome c-type biogenesis protein CcmH
MIRLLALLFALWASSAAAVQPGERLADPMLESRARAISAGLRCLVCQNQSIDDSDAPLARDLRLLVRDRLTAGDSDAQVKDYLVARYGDFVLLRPPFQASTWFLWLTPAFVLIVGALVLVRKRIALPADAGGQRLSGDEEERLSQILREQS